MNIRLPPSYVTHHNLAAVKLADGIGYAGQLGVYHELHCLVSLHP